MGKTLMVVVRKQEAMVSYWIIVLLISIMHKYVVDLLVHEIVVVG
jgi:hypothetical protein